MEQELNIIIITEKAFSDYVRYSMKENNEEVGYIVIKLDNINFRNFVIDVFVDKEIRGFGYGKMLYEHALKQNGSLTTKINEVSKSAKTVWKSLCKNYKYSENKFHGTLTVFCKMAV